MRKCVILFVGVTLSVMAVHPTVFAQEPSASAEDLPEAKRIGKIEPVVGFFDSMPTGVTVSQKGRIFVNFPRWGDPVPFTVAEIVKGQPKPFPDEQVNRYDQERPGDTFVSVQSVVVDPRDRLWILDTGSIKFGRTVPGGPKLVCVDLATNKIVKTIKMPDDVALPTTYLNDVRFDLRHGKEGVAYITDSSDKGPNGIIVVDLDTGKSRRRLHDHPSTKAEPGFTAFVEGQQMMRRKVGDPPKPVLIGSDGIAISHDGKRLFYTALAGRRLYSVDADMLRGEASDTEVVATIKDEGMKPASDGLESDEHGRIYATAYEQNAIVRRGTDGVYETIVCDPRALWPDTLALANDGYLYFIANQLHRQADYNDGKDLRQKPYSLFRVKVDAQPVNLR